MRLAVIFDNLGPYHVARLEAASARCDLLAIEVSARSAQYAWQPAGSLPFRTETLFTAASRLSRLRPRPFAARLGKVLEAFGPSVVAIPGWYGMGGVGALCWAKRSGVRVVVMSDSRATDFRRAFLKEWVKRRYVGMCDAGLVGGRAHAAYLTKLGMAQDHVFTGYDVVGNAFFTSGADSARAQGSVLRGVHKLPQHYFLGSARFIVQKNLDRLVHAYARYRAVAGTAGVGTDALWELVMLGDGEQRQHLEAIIVDQSMEKFVHLPGFRQIDELPVFYGLAECFILPSTAETWGLVVNEAMASGLPVIVSERCGCASELVEEGRNGFTFDPFDIDALVERMLRMAHSATDRAAMGQASREIIARWSPEMFAQGLVDAAEAALKAPPRPMNLLDRAVLAALTRR